MIVSQELKLICPNAIFQQYEIRHLRFQYETFGDSAGECKCIGF